MVSYQMWLWSWQLSLVIMCALSQVSCAVMVLVSYYLWSWLQFVIICVYAHGNDQLSCGVVFKCFVRSWLGYGKSLSVVNFMVPYYV